VSSERRLQPLPNLAPPYSAYQFTAYRIAVRNGSLHLATVFERKDLSGLRLIQLGLTIPLAAIGRAVGHAICEVLSPCRPVEMAVVHASEMASAACMSRIHTGLIWRSMRLFADQPMRPNLFVPNLDRRVAIFKAAKWPE
jgi:hypothetical protein